MVSIALNEAMLNSGINENFCSEIEDFQTDENSILNSHQTLPLLLPPNLCNSKENSKHKKSVDVQINNSNANNNCIEVSPVLLKEIKNSKLQTVDEKDLEILKNINVENSMSNVFYEKDKCNIIVGEKDFCIENIRQAAEKNKVISCIPNEKIKSLKKIDNNINPNKDDANSEKDNNNSSSINFTDRSNNKKLKQEENYIRNPKHLLNFIELYDEAIENTKKNHDHEYKVTENIRCL